LDCTPALCAASRVTHAYRTWVGTIGSETGVEAGARFARRPFVYFAHSYYVPVDARAAAICTYAPIHAALEAGNVFGVQFHPEKSGRSD